MIYVWNKNSVCVVSRSSNEKTPNTLFFVLKVYINIIFSDKDGISWSGLSLTYHQSTQPNILLHKKSVWYRQ